MKKPTIHRSWNKLQIITERKATLSPHKTRMPRKHQLHSWKVSIILMKLDNRFYLDGSFDREVEDKQEF